MKPSEAIHKLEFMRDAYQKLIDESVDEGRVVGTDVTGTWKADTSLNEAYREHVEALDLAISALEKQEAIKSCTPPSDDWEHYADRLHDIAYQSGYEQAKKDAEEDRWIPCKERPEYDFQNVLVRWHDKRKGCEKDYYIFEGYVVRGIWCGLFEDADISDFEPIEWKPLEPYEEKES